MRCFQRVDVKGDYMDWRITSFDQYQKDYKESVENSDEFWAKIADTFTWKKKWDKVQEGGFKDVDFKWFTGGQLNITENCLDRHLATDGDKLALLWEPNDPKDPTVKLSFKELHAEVCKAANMLKSNNVKKGDRVMLYMGMVPELLFSLLACARIGAIHSVVFGGFSANALADRVNDCEAEVIITNDGSYRGAKHIDLKGICDTALEKCPGVKTVIVHERVKNSCNMKTGRDVWWHEEMAKADANCEAVAMDSEDPLFILYTSGSTGKPKGALHSTAGYMIWAAYTHMNVFQVEKDDMYWCTADIGWITGHTYITYGPLLNCRTTVMFEGVPTWPDAGRFWDVVDKHKITHFYTAPTAIRALMAQGDSHVERANLSSLKILGTVGEPINEEAWNWYYEKVGKKNCPIVDTWWQTETGGIMISTLGNITPMKTSFATLPLPGVQPLFVDENGKEIDGNGVNGNLCMRKPWPGTVRTVYGDHERFKNTYFTTYPGLYFTGDGCLRDEEGLYRITGRVDDVINVSGHRIGTAEVEDAINQDPGVVESAVVGFPHEIKGAGIYAYVITHNKVEDEAAMRKSILATVVKEIGPIAKPDQIQFVPGLPKTRSGKIMRRILRKVAEGDSSNLGDTSTLLDPSVVEDIKTGALVKQK